MLSSRPAPTDPSFAQARQPADAAGLRQPAELKGEIVHDAENLESAGSPMLCLAASVRPIEAQPPARAQDAALIAKGEYLARAGDCIACHTAREGKIFAGGLPMKTPFGTLYTSNITPDPQTGIGTWTSDQFYQMMHNGRFPDGGLVYPAMPFASYTKVTREDSDAIYAYLRSIAPVKQINRPHDLKFPFNNRSLILGWRTLFFKEGVYKPDPTKSAEWNRGAYLVEGLGHCGMCHTADQCARRQFGVRRPSRAA